MRITITFEDTPTGITFDADSEHNGVSDHITKSIAFLLASQVHAHVQKMVTRTLLGVPHENNPAH